MLWDRGGVLGTAPALRHPLAPARLHGRSRAERAEGCVHACAPTHARFSDSCFMYLCVNIFWGYSSPSLQRAACSTTDCSWPPSTGSYSCFKQRLNNDFSISGSKPRSRSLILTSQAGRMPRWPFLPPGRNGATTTAVTTEPPILQGINGRDKGKQRFCNPQDVCRPPWDSSVGSPRVPKSIS